MRWPKAAVNSRWPILAARVGKTFDWLVDEGEGCGSVAGAAVRKGAATRAIRPGRHWTGPPKASAGEDAV